MAAVTSFYNTSYNLEGPTSGIWIEIITQGIESLQIEAH